MTRREVILGYIDFLGKGGIADILKLFNSEAIIISPIYGRMKASDFYHELAKDTQSSELILKTIYEENDSGNCAIYFNYKWTLATGKIIEFDVVDLIEFDQNGLILELKIIYDASVTKAFVSERS